MTSTVDAISVAVAKGVAEHLEAASAANLLSQPITPERSYADWELELEEENVLRVDVVAWTTEQKTELAARGSRTYEIPIAIAVRKKFGTQSQDDDTGRIEIDEIDSLVLLVEKIEEQFTAQRLADFQCAAWKETKILVVPNREHLHRFHQFTGIVKVVFQASKPI